MKPLPALLLILLAALATTQLAAAQRSNRPNVVLIFMDDLGYGDIGPFGATLQKTPNLDRMAREGMKLTSFYAAPVCSVSRAQLLTGCYGARVSVPGVFGPASRFGLHPQEHTLAERLKPLGYATACIGKWHLGDQPPFLPTRQGFDEYLGIPYSNDMQRKSVQTGERVVPLVRGEKVEELLNEEGQGRIVERYTDAAVRFVRENRDRPFFLYLPHTAVHTPIHPGAAFRGKSANGRFGDWVEEADWSVGRVLETLRELKLDRRTLVVFTSDNGPWLVKGPDGGSAGPLRGGKGSTWEGGVREPTLAWWPGRIPPESTCDAVAGTIDLLPTCVSVAGGTVPAEPVVDGRDLSPLLFESSTRSPREAHYYFAGYNLQAVRRGPWKLAVTPQARTAGGIRDEERSPRLYNLDTDIGEKSDVAEQHPEIVASLKKLAERMSAEIGGAAPTARRPPGEVRNPTTLYPSEPPAPQANRNGPNTPPVDLGALKPGAQVASTAAPNVANRPFTLSCVVETAQPDTILIAHGGLSAGYALHRAAGRIVFSVRTGPGDAVTSITAPDTTTGRCKVVAVLATDGTMTLSVNERRVAAGKAPGLIPRQPQEPFCVGHDSGKPVAAYTGNLPFQGTITGLMVTSP